MAEISFLLDEHLPASVAEELLSRGVDIGTVHDYGLEGASDSRILDFAEKEDKVLVTQDTDFLEMETTQVSPS